MVGQASLPVLIPHDFDVAGCQVAAWCEHIGDAVKNSPRKPAATLRRGGPAFGWTHRFSRKYRLSVASVDGGRAARASSPRRRIEDHGGARKTHSLLDRPSPFGTGV